MAYSSARNHLNLQVKTLLASSTHDPGMAQPMDHSAVALPPATIHEQQDPESAGTTAALYKEQHPHPPTSAHIMSKALTINHQHSIQQRPHSTPLSPPKQRSHKRLHQTFQLPTTEKLIAEFPSWLFRSVLLKGSVCLTDAHLCFHAFLKSNEREPDEDRAATKSGILSRRHARKLNQPHSTIKSWFILKDTILSWYPSSHEPYFPTGQIDLHFCTKVEPAPPNSKHPNQFKLVVSGKVYTFCSDTQQSKDEWVKALQQTVFASQHGGQNVKLAIPLTSIETIEKCDSIQFAQTVCIKIKQNVPVVPFAQKKPSVIPPEEIGDRSLVDYFFGFLQDSQTPYELLIAALERVQASSPTTVVVAPQDPSTSSLPSPIRDSTRFKIITHSTKSTAEHCASNLSPAVMSSCSGSQTPISSDTNHPQPSSNPDERKTKFTDKITKIASTSNKFVGSPIRPAFDTVKVHSPRPMSASAILPRTMESFTRPSTPDSAPSSLIFQSTPPPPSSSTLDQAVKKLSDSPLKLDKLARSSTLAQQSPKDRRPQYSTYSPRGEKLDTSTPTSTHNNSPIPTPHESPYVEPNKSWALLPGWIKNVPATLINPAKGTPNSPKASSTPQDRSPVSAPKKDVPTRSASTDKLSDEDRSHREAQLTSKDQLKFETEFNFLNPSALSKSTHSDGSVIRLLLKTKCNLIRGGSSMYGQVYLASPVHSPKQIKNLRKSCICFKGQKWISSAPVKMILPIEALTAVRTEAIKLYLTTQPTDLLNGQEEVCFEFATAEQMKPVHDEVMRMIESNKLQIGDEQPQAEAEEEADKEEENEEEEDDDESSLPIMFQSSSSSFLTFKPKSKLHITCLTIGSRGDVQPYIALCQQLQLDGHTCRIASHGEYRKWVEGYGIEYVEIGGDPAELMKMCVDNGMFTLGFLKEAFSKFRGWLDELLVSSFDACQGTDLLIESPSTMAGIHIAEALQIPYFRAFTMPWTRTKEYPHAFAVPDRKMGSGYNYMTYTVFDQVFWKAMSGQVNKWRKEKLGLRSTTYEKLEIHKVPFLYNFSPSIVPSPLDWYEWIHVTGYWFIDEDDPNKLHQQPSLTQSSDPLSDSLIDTHQSPIAQIDSQSPTVKSPLGKPTAEKSSWDPPADLISFLDRAHGQNKKVVYIGFGSVVVPDPEATTKVIIESVKSAGVYAIISKGWSERLQQSSSGTKKGKRAAAEDLQKEEPEDLSMIYHINSIPHDWLFPRIDAVCHHGGAGTTGASLRAGLPTIIKPFFGDQFFWAERVESLGIGAAIRKLTVKNLALALLHATSDPTQISRAKLVGQQIRAENGAAKAVECIYRDLDYARSLIKRSPIKPVDPILAASITETKPNNLETVQDPNRSSAMSKQEIGDSSSGSCGEVLLKTETESEMESSGISSEEESAPESSLMLMSAHSSVSVEDEPGLPSTRSSGDFFDCQPAPVPSTSTSSVIPSSTISPIEGPPFHCLSGQKSDNTLVPPKSSTADQDHLPAVDPSDPKGKKPAAATNNVATTDDEGSNSSSGSSWDILSQLSKSDPPSNPDIDASFVRF